MSLRARIETITEAGEAEAVVTLALRAGEGQRLPARITRRSLAALELTPAWTSTPR